MQGVVIADFCPYIKSSTGTYRNGAEGSKRRRDLLPVQPEVMIEHEASISTLKARIELPAKAVSVEDFIKRAGIVIAP